MGSTTGPYASPGATSGPYAGSETSEQWCNCQCVTTWHPLGDTSFCDPKDVELDRLRRRNAMVRAIVESDDLTAELAIRTLRSLFSSIRTD